MKNILNKVGAISKPVLFGAALGVATVAVGIGVATNFLTDGPKGSSGRALSHYSADTAQVVYGDNDGIYYNDNLSKEALEQQMALNQANSGNENSLNYLGAAGKGRFAYGQKGTAYENGTIDPMAMNNAGYEGENNLETGMSPEMANAMGNFNNIASAATAGAATADAKATDGKKNKDGKKKEELESSDSAFGTQVNKLSSSGKMGSGTFASAKGGGSRNIGQIQGYGGGDRVQTPINTPNIGNMPVSDISGIDGKKHGRVGQMGGNGARGGTRGNGGSGQSYGFDGATVALLHAQKYSNLGTKTNYTEEAKVFVEEAFDGSVTPDEGVQIDGSTPITERAAKLETAGNKINNKNNTKPLDTIGDESNILQDAKKNLMWATIAMLGTMLAAAIAISYCGNSLWGWIAKIAILVAGLAAVWLMYGTWMLKHIKALQELKYIQNSAGAWPWLAPTIAGVCSAVMAAALFTKVSTAIKNFVKNVGKNFSKKITKIGNMFKA